MFLRITEWKDNFSISRGRTYTQANDGKFGVVGVVNSARRYIPDVFLHGSMRDASWWCVVVADLDKRVIRITPDWYDEPYV